MLAGEVVPRLTLVERVGLVAVERVRWLQELEPQDL